jgi:hypothetical protein
VNKLAFKFFALAVASAMASVVMAGSNDDAETLNQISGYRQWTKVNSEPVKVEISLKIDPALVVS